MLSRLFAAALWSPAGKQLTSWLLFVSFNCVLVTFPCGILGQVWYLIVSIPDLCRFHYLNTVESNNQSVRSCIQNTRKKKLFSVLYFYTISYFYKSLIINKTVLKHKEIVLIRSLLVYCDNFYLIFS